MKTYTVGGISVEFAETRIGQDVTGVDGTETHSVIPAIAYYSADKLGGLGDGDGTHPDDAWYIWPKHKALDRL